MTYKVGIVGSGFGVRAHLPAFNAHPAFEVVALASPSSATTIARERGIPSAFESGQAMLAGAEIDVLSVASPPFTHKQNVLAALAAGKHVVCEKPFALNVRDAETMRDAARAAGTAAAVMHEFRWIPQRQAMKELIANGHVDPLRHIELTQLTGFLRAGTERKNGWWFDRERGGGLAGALLSHLIDSATWLAGRPPVRASGFLRTANPRRRDAQGAFTSTVDDGSFALIDYGDGLIARVTVDATSAVESFTIAVHGEHRTAVASGSGAHAMRLFSVDADETNELECKPSPHAGFASVDPHVPPIMDLLDEFVKQIEVGSSAVPTFDEALETQRVLEAIGFGGELTARRRA